MAQATNDICTLYVDLLKRLRGVYAANVRTDEEGHIEEIHLLTGASRNAKQTVRDARSALLAAYGIDTDYQKISVAQISEPLAESFEGSKSGARLRSSQLEQSILENRYTVKAALEYRGAMFEGSATATNTPNQRQRAVAEAVIAAIHDYLGDDHVVFSLLGVSKISSLPVPIFVTLVECLEDSDSVLLVGAAQVSENEAISIERATLDAVNRKLSVLKA